MSTAADKALMAAVLSQVDIGKLNYEKLAKDLHLPNKSAASMRWYRFKARLYNGAPPAKATSAVVAFPPNTPSKIAKGKNGSPPTKKRKRAQKDSDGETPDDELGLDAMGEPDDEGLHEAAVSRRLPIRKARATSFKHLEDDEEDEEDGAADVASGDVDGGVTTEDSEGISENWEAGDVDEA